ncbi:unnamed protein product, partial [Hapterophycus canaliculatus]
RTLYLRLAGCFTLVSTQMTEAFPDVGWVYLFRDPVEVMVSNLKVC